MAEVTIKFAGTADVDLKGNLEIVYLDTGQKIVQPLDTKHSIELDSDWKIIEEEKHDEFCINFTVTLFKPIICDE